jgi:aspartate kinase
MIVLKFGGTSVQNAEMMDATLSIVEGQLERAPVLVSSAMSNVTDQLQEIAKLVGAGRNVEAEAVSSPWRSTCPPALPFRRNLAGAN